MVGLAAIETALMYGNLAAGSVAAAQVESGLDVRSSVTALGNLLMTAIEKMRGVAVAILKGDASELTSGEDSDEVNGSLAAVRSQLALTRTPTLELPTGADLLVLLEWMQRGSTNAYMTLCQESALPPGDALLLELQVFGGVASAMMKVVVDLFTEHRTNPAFSHDLSRLVALTRRFKALGLACVCVSAASRAFLNAERSPCRFIAATIVASAVNARITFSCIGSATHSVAGAGGQARTWTPKLLSACQALQTSLGTLENLARERDEASNFPLEVRSNVTLLLSENILASIQRVFCNGSISREFDSLSWLHITRPN